MTKPTLTKVILLAAIAMVGLSLAVAAINKRRQRLVWHQSTAAKKASPENDPNDSRSLKDKAKEKGRFVGYQAQSDAKLNDLSALANGSALIVIGVPKTNISRMSADGKNITLDYTVKVEYVYKGKDGLQGDDVTVSLPGGMVSFDDGTVAEIRAPWFKKMQDGKTYLLFLEKAEAGRYVPTAGPEGIFEIPTDSSSREVKVHVSSQDDPMWKYDSTDVRQFLREVRKLTKTAGAR